MDAIKRARAVYRRLQGVPDEALAASRTLPETVDHAVRMGEAGRAPVARVQSFARGVVLRLAARPLLAPVVRRLLNRDGGRLGS